MPPLRLLPALLMLALLCHLPAPATAGRLRPPAPLVELEVVDRDTGEVLPDYRHAGQAWIAGAPGHRYAVRLRNRTGTRLLAVLSVDGINAIDGRTADPGQAGYVLGPWQTLDVGGWRKSLGAVARFVFVDPSASYAARTGRPDDLGVIGVAVFRERSGYQDPTIGIARERRAEAREAAPAPASDAMRSEHRTAGAYREPHPPASLGTGHGAIEGSQAYYTVFEREAAPAQLTELRYDTRAALLARGIRVDPSCRPLLRCGADHGQPRAFPGFAPDP